MSADAPVLAAHAWPSNAALIADVAKLYFQPRMRFLDATYGRGKWWDIWRPEVLVCNDRWTCNDVARETGDFVYGYDFCNFPDVWHEDFDVVTFDPPYVCVGGRATTTLPDMHDRYGLTDAPKSPNDLQELIDRGLAECVRVLKRRGLLLVKCQDYITSGKLFLGTHRTLSYALGLGLVLEDRFEHVASHPRPQPPGRRQVHARRNLSTLLVFRKP